MRPEVLALSINQFRRLCLEFLKPEQQHRDARKNQFKRDLLKLSSYFMTYSVHHLNDVSIDNVNRDLKLFWGWAASLDAKNGYTLSRETRGILDSLCRLWIPDYNMYIFASTDGDFAVNRHSADWKVLAESINKVYHVDFQSYLVTFYIPKHLKDDYLFIGTIYHEFGHFYVGYNNMVDVVAQNVKEEIDNATVYANELLTVWFEAIDFAKDKDGKINIAKRDAIIDSQTEEYMADLFGAQYLGEHLTAHIESNRQGRMDLKTETHPTPNKRNQLIEEFYDLGNHKDNLFLQWIMDAFQDEGKPLQKRYLSLDDTQLKSGAKMTFNNDEELHSIFHLAWEVYLQQMAPTVDALGNKIPTPIDYNIYKKINEAVRQSIEAYLKL